MSGQWRVRRGGTVVNVVTAIVFLGLLGGGVYWVIKGLGEATEEYSGAVVKTRRTAMSTACHANMNTIMQNLQIYATTEGGLPESMEELRRWSGNSKLYRCPDPKGSEYIFVEGQNGKMPGDNILIYEPNAVHNGRSNVLRLNGKIELLTPEQLNEALAQTRANIRSGR